MYLPAPKTMAFLPSLRTSVAYAPGPGFVKHRLVAGQVVGAGLVQKVVADAGVMDVKQPVFVQGFEIGLAGGYALCSVEQVGRQRGILRQRFTRQHPLHVYGFAQRAVGEGPTKALLQGRIPRPRDALYYAPDALRRDGVRVLLALDQDELAVSAVLFIQSENGVGSCAAAGKGVQDDRIFVREYLNYGFD